MQKYLLFLFSITLLTGCTQNIEIANNNISIEASLNTNKSYQQEWAELEPGIQYKELPIYSDSGNDLLQDVVIIFKFKKDAFDYSLKQNIENPKTVSEWQGTTKAKFACNGGYFLEDYTSSGILKIDGNKFGSKLNATSVGELVINENNLKIFIDADINKYKNVLQSYPLLVQPDREKTVIEDSGKTAPRTVIAKDNSGNVLFIFTQSYYFSLYKLQNYLMESDLDIQIALNLDGGPSSGYYYKGKENKISESAMVPNVIIVQTK